MKTFKLVLVAIIMSLFCVGAKPLFAAAPLNVIFQATLSSQTGGLLEGRKTVSIGIYPASGVTTTTANTWVTSNYNVLFVNGSCSFILGAPFTIPLTSQIFDQVGARIGLTVEGYATVYFPLSSAPYAIQSRLADEVKSLDASKIIGSFTSANILGDLKVGSSLLYVDSTNNKIGIGTSTPSSSYILDIAGRVNATGYQINGSDIQTSIWQKTNNDIYYFATGNAKVGIGTTTPSYTLDVVGTVNATGFSVGGVTLSDYLGERLLWQKAAQDGDIYFNRGTSPGKVGIGTSSPQERLDVNGGVHIGAALGAQTGTLQYINGEFQGFTTTGWQSLIGLRAASTVRAGQVVFWADTKTITGSDNFFWDSTNNRLGLGTATPSARLDIRGVTGDADLLVVKNSLGNSILYVGSANVGIGTTSPIYKLQVSGNVDAKAYTLNGQPLQTALSNSTYWLLENNVSTTNQRIFYDLGNVGIGTNDPKNLLELSSITGNAGIGFSIGSQSLFTIGVESKTQDAFIISKGSDFSSPIFVFKGDKIGVGIKDPSANLQISGNSGIVISGQLDGTQTIPATGAGTRMMWYPAKSVFRAGTVEGDEWDDANDGLYSTAMGYGPVASGRYSVVLGGYKNRASGDYSAVLGGFQNVASGAYSYAMGYQAQALHNGSFVYADYTPSTSAFASTGSNQFLIRASGGVGIGTNDTASASLTVSSNQLTGYLFRAVGNSDGAQAFSVSTSGNVGIGTTDTGTARLAVMNGKVGIGTTQPDALLTVSDVSQPYLFKVVGSPLTGTPTIFVITSSGNVGIGTENPTQRLVVNGSIVGTSFQVRDPNNPSATITINPNPGSPWSDPDKNNGNTFRSQGLVGIGTPSPNSLLELSNRSGNDAMLTFDISGTKRYSMGVTSNLFVIKPGGNPITSGSPTVVMSDTGVGIGLGFATPSANLHVSGNTILSGKVAIGTTNVSSSYPVLVDGSLSVNSLYIADQQFIPRDTPWRTNGLNIYYSSGNVGIGTSLPQTPLEVNGTISANTLILARNFDLQGFLTTDYLNLKDIAVTTSPSVFGKLFVSTGNLEYTDPSGNTKIISSPLQRGTGNTGALAFWVDSSTLAQTSINVDIANSKLDLGGSMVINNTFSENNGLTVTNSVSMVPTQPFRIDSRLNHQGLLTSVRDFHAQDINVSIDQNWGNTSKVVSVRGMNISMGQTSGLFLNNAAAVGLYVDVTNIETDTTGFKAAAVFQGGPVGIGLTNPRADLEVNGTVSANFFNLSGGLNVPNLIVGTNTLVAKADVQGNPLVGIGVTTPNFPLEVAGLVSMNSLVVQQGITATTMNINNGSFYLDATGNIGIGTTLPNGQIEISKTFSAAASSNFTSEKIGITVDGAAPNSNFFFDKNITGLDVNIRSTSPVNMIAAGKQAVGINVDMSSAVLQSNSVGTGLNVNVSGTTGTRYAALFNGGYVGIGTTTPQAELHVSGNIIADNLFLQGTLSAGTVTFNSLYVTGTTSVNGTVTINSLVVTDTLTANVLALNNALTAPSATFGSLVAGTVSVNSVLKVSNLVVTQNFSGSSATFSGGIGIGIATAPTTGITVSGNVTANSMVVVGQLNATNATVNINSNTLFIPSATANVGIGTSQPYSKLHIAKTTASSFLARSTDTWGLLRIQTAQSALNTAAGIVMIPDSVVTTSSVGSGIAAVRSNAVSNTPGSHLVFITDPEDSTPVERMRITSEGLVGIGTTQPATQLDVNGDMTVGTTLNVTTALVTPLFYGASGVTVDTGTGVLTVQGATSHNSDVMVGGSVLLKKSTTTPATVSNYGIVYVTPTGNLAFVSPAGAQSDITFVGVPGRIPFFDASQSLSSAANLFWDTSAQKLTIGTPNALTTMEIVSTLDNTTVGTVDADKISMYITNRTTASSSTFTGLNINFASTPLESADPNNFGRLGNGETATGVKVNLSNLSARYTTAEAASASKQGYKYSALFLGGNVGVGTTQPDATFHVINETPGLAVVRIDGNSSTSTNYFVVTSNGYVGVGVANPSAQFAIKSSSSTSTFGVLDVQNNSGTSVLFAQNNGQVGIGTTVPSANLHVVGTFRADSSSVSNVLVVSANGLVGVKTGSPTALLHVNGPFLVDVGSTTNALLVTANGVGIGTATVNYALNVRDKIQLGANYSGSVASWITDSTTKGYLVRNGSESAFFGLRARSATEYDSVLNWGGSANSALRFNYWNGTSSTNVMTVSSNGTVGIGTTVPAAALHIVSAATPLWVGSSTTPDMLVVSANGYVGIGTSLPTTPLTVAGSISARQLDISSGQIDVTTLNVSQLLNVATTLNVAPAAGATYNAQTVRLGFGADIGSGDLIGMNINVASLPIGNGLSGNWAVYNNAAAYGLKVDVTGVDARAGDNSGIGGNKYAALFKGGYVGIGTTQPTTALEVQGTVGGDLARFGSGSTFGGDLTIRDYGSGTMGFRMRDLGDPNTVYDTLFMARDKVGIGTSTPQNALVVNGDVRVGIIRESASSGTAGNGDKLFFSGGPILNTGYGSDNNTQLWISRYNVSNGVSELRVNIATSNTSFSNTFSVGYTNTGTFTPVLDVYPVSKNVAIMGSGISSFVPKTTLHIKASTAGDSSVSANHAVIIENTGGNTADSLAIMHTGLASVGTDSNFITFMNNSSVLGEIEGNGSSGVRYKTTGADYAEYLYKETASDTFEKGDIVGVTNGKISKNTQGVQQVMVKSSGASVAGNWPGKDKMKLVELISFFGQVPVKVRGVVHAGDYLVPSGYNDGTAVAVSPDHISPAVALIVGRAWTSSNKEEVKLINTAVGFNFSMPPLQKTLTTVEQVQKDVASLHQERDEIVKRFNDRLDKQNQDIEQLMSELNTISQARATAKTQ
ncbi:MAG: hypothetical protein AB7F28_00600 [Candidatus Margulisiibacteriota bacterium]